MTNQEWEVFLSKEFNVSKNTAKAMLHCLMYIKRQDSILKQIESDAKRTNLNFGQILFEKGMVKNNAKKSM